MSSSYNDGPPYNPEVWWFDHHWWRSGRWAKEGIVVRKEGKYYVAPPKGDNFSARFTQAESLGPYDTLQHAKQVMETMVMIKEFPKGWFK